MKNRLKEIVGLLDEHFNDRNKVRLWLKTPNPLLGGFSPSSMIKLGRETKLLAFIKTAVNEGKITNL